MNITRYCSTCVRQTSFLRTIYNRDVLQKALTTDLSKFYRMISVHPNVCLKRDFHSSVYYQSSKARNTKKKLVKKITFTKNKAQGEPVPIRKGMTVLELARAMNKDADHVLQCLSTMKNISKEYKPNTKISDLLVIEHVVKVSGLRFAFQKLKEDSVKEEKNVHKRTPDELEMNYKRPPVVTIMGHVDHGKTTLLDNLRNTNVVAQEYGGITQHIGAFSVKLPSGEEITFLDTPGHAAFTSMRARGANVTDIVILVVAADDGVMEQTSESIRLANEANVPIIVAINKMDKPTADVDFTKQKLLEAGLQLEDIGGDVQSVPVSALKGTNLDLLQESIIALAEVMDLKADDSGPVEGTVIEAKTHIGRGKLCTALIEHGTLRKGSVVVAGTAWAKVRGMFDDKGRPVMKVPPGKPVEIIGWKDLPSAGEDIIQVGSEHEAREIINWRLGLKKDEMAEKDLEVIKQKRAEHQKLYEETRAVHLEKGIRRAQIFKRIREKETIEGWAGPELAIVVKADVDGSLEAILDTLDTYDSEQCRLHLLSYGVGPVTDHDVEMAASFNGVIYRFNVDCPDKAAATAKSKDTQVVHHNVIYKMIDDIRDRMTEMLPTVEEEEEIGEANVLQTFMITEGKKKLPVAGCRCTKGALQKSSNFKLLRNDECIYEGTLASLKHFKNEVNSIKKDMECGLRFDDMTVVPQPGDIIICYDLMDAPQTLDWDLHF